MIKAKEKQYIYIVQASLEPSKCKIGKTNNLGRRLKEYNSMTGKSKENIYSYLFSCEVKNMTEVENNIKDKFSTLREEKNKEIYFFNSDLFKNYIKFIKAHSMFVKEIFIKTENKKDIVKKEAYQLEMLCKKLRKLIMMNFIQDMKMSKMNCQCIIKVFGKTKLYFVIVMML